MRFNVLAIKPTVNERRSESRRTHRFEEAGHRSNRVGRQKEDGSKRQETHLEEIMRLARSSISLWLCTEKTLLTLEKSLQQT